MLMIPRLWLKNKILDRFDHLDTNQLQANGYSNEKWTLLQSFPAENTQKHGKDYLLRALLSELTVGQKPLIKHYKNGNMVTINITLAKIKSYIFQDILNSSLFLTESWKLSLNKSLISLKTKSVSELNELLINFKSNKNKVLFDQDFKSSFFICINIKNGNINLYKKLIKESSSIG